MRLSGWLTRCKRERVEPVRLDAGSLAAESNARSQALEALQRGQVLAKLGKHAAAEAALEESLALCHDLAPTHMALGRLQLERGRIEDAVDSLELAVFFAPDDASAQADLGLALARSGARDEAGVAAERALALGSGQADVWAACGRVYKALDRLELAAECYQGAVGLASDSAHYACQLGYIHFLRGNYDAARLAYDRALGSDPKHVPALHDLGLLELEMGCPVRALELFRLAVELDPNLPSRACVGHALRDLGHLADACVAYRNVLAEQPAFGDARINLSYALLMNGDLEAGWEQYEHRFEATGTPAREFGLPRWRGEPLAGKRLLVYAEQGLGDEIMFASCVPDVLARAGDCVLECNTRLEALFARSFGGALVHGGEKDADTSWLTRYPPCDYQVPIGSLPGFFRRSASDFPVRPGYLAADAGRVAATRARVCDPAKLNVGFAWRGGALRTRQWLRSIPLALWSPLLELPECRFVALQHGDHSVELASMRSGADADIVDLSSASVDIDELATVVAALDLIITVDNTLGHIAGALGCPVWVLLPQSPEWRYPRTGIDMLWYPSMRLFRQTGPRAGAQVMVELVRSLRKHMADGKA